MADRTRLVHFTYTWTSSGVSGFISNVSRELSESFDQTIVVWENRGTVFDDEIRDKGIEIVTLCKGRSKGIMDLSKACAAFRRYLKKEKPEIVHLHCSTSLELKILLAAKQAKVPLRVAHCHNAGFEGSKLAKYIKQQIHIAYKDEFASFANMRLACSKAAGDWLFPEGFPYTVIKNAIDVDRYMYSEEKRKALREKLGLKDEFTFCCTGRLSEQKNQAVLVEAFARYHQTHPNSALLLAGDGPERGNIENLLSTHGIGHCVKMLGVVSDVGAVLSASDAYVLPSRFEGFGTAVLEAQVNGLPCLVSDTVSKEADLMGNAIRNPWDSSPALWTNALEILSERERYNGIDVARASGYTKEKVASYLATLYHSALTDLSN